VAKLFASLAPPSAFYPAFACLVIVCLLVRWLYRRHRGAESWDGVVRTLERTTMSVLLLGMLGFAVLQIILRNFFDSGLVWIEPLLRHLVLWIGFAGAVVAAGRLRHIQMDVVGRLLPMAPRLWVVRFTTLVATLICSVLARAAWVFLGQESEAGLTGFLSIPTWILLAAILIGFSLIAVRFAARLFTSSEDLEEILIEAQGTGDLAAEMAAAIAPEPEEEADDES